MQVLADDLKERYVDNRIKSVLDSATYLDVRFKETFVSNPLRSETERSEAAAEGRAQTVKRHASESEVSAASEGCTSAKRVKTKSNFGDLLARIRSEKKREIGTQNPEGTVPISKLQSLRNELILYEKNPRVCQYTV